MEVPASSEPSISPLIEVTGLVKQYRVGGFPNQRTLTAVDGVDFTLSRGEAVGLVGESGCGKSTTGRCLVGLTTPTAGAVKFDGHKVTNISGKERRQLYRRIQMVFQDPSSALNPRMTIRALIGEPLRLQLSLRGAALQTRVEELVAEVGLSKVHLDRYPQQLSGGQGQRVAIARAIATRPDFIVLDEPTASLDVSVRGVILQLLAKLRSALELSYLFISHDLSVVRHLCDRVMVMYLGKIVEQGPTDAIFRQPHHPYTRALLSAVPIPEWGARQRRISLVGDIPSPINAPPGCRLVGRCPLEIDRCRSSHPPFFTIAGDHDVACYVTGGGFGVGDERMGGHRDT